MRFLIAFWNVFPTMLKKKWRRRGFGTGQLLLVGVKLLVHAESGKLAIIEANPDKFSEHGSIDTVEGTC